MSKVGRTFTAEQRHYHIAAQRQSGLTIAKYCQQNNLSPSTFDNWKWRMKKKPNYSVTDSFIEIPIVASNPIEIRCGNFQITVSQPFDPLHLTNVLSSVRKALS